MAAVGQEGEKRRFEKILIVDDNELFRNALHRQLSRVLPGAQVALAGTADDARRTARDAPFEMIFIDLMLGGACGLRLIERVRPLQPEAWIVLMSQWATLRRAAHAGRLGADDVVDKPVDVVDVVEYAGGTIAESRPRTLRQRQQDIINDSYDMTGDNASETARRLDISPKTVYAHLAPRDKAKK